ncbi:PEP/pyruvate-binding domain-containing protein [Pseudodesulfovibrio sp. zrk46]|uniref:PEP/pyruvate-binding domain-containing protein n=1 Tax=Pseudodesulfovibrio sp. zrk46 TaxID=2725288 RepID=UPI001449DE28|nr:PEP/pyruvate-binding domain-containing protein [Pseudodesulfovibrio sp. zrk46]QJB56720.1 pyruvate, water dikinase [Pseudodesulfovibrio sp. zrk46]
MGFFDWFPFFGKPEKSPEEIAEMRRTLSERYDHFRLLLQANNNAHELMGELEEALRGFTPYGMHYVRTLCTRISTSIFQMVRHLTELNPKAYAGLMPAYQSIQANIMPHLEAGEDYKPPRVLVLNLADVGRDHADLTGPKMAMLGEAGRALNMNIPEGFVVTTDAFRAYMRAGGREKEIDRLIQMVDPDDREAMFRLSSRIMQMVIDARLPNELAEKILAAYDDLRAATGQEVKLAVRSSALGEDIEGASFAGQYRSILNVDRSSLLNAYKEVVASKYSLQAMAYRLAQGIRDEDVAMSVGCMVMVDARSGGVAYSRSPVNIRDERVSVHSVWGLPKAVVDGSIATDEFQVGREPAEVVERLVAEKVEQYGCHDAEGICRLEVLDQNQNVPSLSDEEAVRVAAEAVKLEEYFGLPQDVEWAVTDDGVFHLLQCRPLMLMDEDEGPHEAVGDLPSPLLHGGRTASPGVGVGPVHVIRKDADALTFPDGGVMVLRQALPSRAALLDRCSAVITEQGGIAGHLANVAREFGVPAIFRVKGAMDSLENGQIVTVDADGHGVYDGAVEALLVEKPRQRVMRGSPVQATLRRAARHIVRLNLTNPEAPEFRPSGCKTLHDIMRFAHEMAVREMFEMSTHEDFIQAASRQLICGVPKQFWVLNLDDGISPEGEDREDRCVLLEHVDSFPMRALWEGMQAVPWEGPPPMHAGGLMSVMFEATANPNLVPAGRSHYTQKNYFMISKNYCCLQSRFGFHFCGVESLVSDRISENYASFQFKGGAANVDRRVLRAKFIGDLLEDFDFRVRIRQDNMFARVEGLDREEMDYRLKIIGYLVTHTRQLDMIMTNATQVKEKREKFLADFKMFKK